MSDRPQSSDEIREAFLSYFEAKGHLRMPSSSLIPVGDPTLLLTNAGMVQFKPYFAGEATPPNKRLTTSQKSFRTVDIDEVGDSTHLTMFEMLGNFSIGDYFKKEAIEYALGFLSLSLGLSKERFAITVHDTDDEAFGLWQEAGIAEGRIYRFGDEDNWWGPPIHGLEGPCGPSSELHYDFGGHRGCGRNDCGPNCLYPLNDDGDACNRFVELWNLVFMQFNHQIDGSRIPLPSPGIDTGMSLERAAIVLQGVDTVYETDVFKPLIQRVEEVSGKSYKESRESSYAISVLAEHGRSAAFLIADGVVPGNEGRGYVLRRVIRRAIRHGRRLGMKDAFLGEIAALTIENMGHIYPELRNHQSFIQTVISLEENKFQQAFQNGFALLSEALSEGDSLTGEEAFRLWDTYGFPLEITQEIALESGVGVDVEGFEREMEAQRERARASASFEGDRAKIQLYESLGIGETKFLGYEQVASSSIVVGLISKSQVVDEAHVGDDVELVLLETPFYPEGGGQIGDAGEMMSRDGRVDISDTQTMMPGLIVHFGKVAEGKVVLGDTVDAHVDRVRRQDTACNHTATHMLHAALRQVLGPHVRQAGSLVAPDRLRFDFSHVEPVSEREKEEVQLLVNERIRQDVDVHSSEDSYVSAIQRGALAFFGDKYEDTVRLIDIANGESFSFEVCGGTHVDRTGEIGAVYILGESSIGAGMRRIEAVSGRAAERLVSERLAMNSAVAELLRVPLSDIQERLQSLLDESDNLKRENEALQRKLSLQSAEGLLEEKRDVCGVPVLATRVAVTKAESLREIGDWLRGKMGTGIVVLGSVVDDRPVLVAMVTSDLIARGFNAADIVRGAAKLVQGGGGGKPDVAQAGGRDADKLDEALGLVADIVSDTLDTGSEMTQPRKGAEEGS